MIPQKQLSLADIYENCKTFFDTDKPHFLSLLEETINLDELIPLSFVNHFYASTGRPRKYSLKEDTELIISNRQYDTSAQFQWTSMEQEII